MRLIGIAGPAGAGKSTTAGVLAAACGFTELAFSDPMKRIVKDALGFTEEQLWGPSELRDIPDRRFPREKHVFPLYRSGEHCACCGLMLEAAPKPCYLTPRYALQLLGTEWGRHCYPNIWVDKTLQIASTLASPGVVISDVRFENEAAAIRASGGVIWFKRPTPFRHRHRAHESELGIVETSRDRIVPWTEDPTMLARAIEDVLAACERNEDR